jgi:hypothetical protein
MHWKLFTDTPQPVWWGHPSDPDQSSISIERFDWRGINGREPFWSLGFAVQASSDGDDPEPLKRLAEMIQLTIDKGEWL